MQNIKIINVNILMDLGPKLTIILISIYSLPMSACKNKTVLLACKMFQLTWTMCDTHW